jgi:hypothetical protein
MCSPPSPAFPTCFSGGSLLNPLPAEPVFNYEPPEKKITTTKKISSNYNML